jgi:peptidoglycan/LPS O-acetylase OafA/YrhL
MENTLNRSYTDMIKFLACILIFAGHYYLEGYAFAVGEFGYIGCVLFFALSAYGIVKSQEKKHLSFMPFFKHRLLKIWIPLMLVNFIFILFESLKSKSITIPTYHVLQPHLIILAKEDIISAVLYVFDISKIDGVTWFLHELIFGYLVLWGLMKIPNKKRRIVIAIICYILAEMLFYGLKMPKMMKIDTIGLLLGFLYVSGENAIHMFLSKHFKWLLTLSISFAILIKFALSYINQFLTNYFIIFDMFNISLAVTMFFVMILIGFQLQWKKSKTILYLGTLSYYVYLTHMKVISYLDTFLPSGFLILIAIFVFSVVVEMVISRIMRKI